MAITTTNFGWDIPQSTDLVKDGATAIAALGQDIDTAFVDLKGGTTGQVLSKASATDLDYSWVTTDDANAIQNSIVDAKGDLIAATANDTPARLAIGAVNGMGLQVDSTAATGMKWDYDKVVQIVAASTDSQVSLSTNTLTDTTLTATITPKSASNKILVFVSQNGVLKDTNNTSATIVLLRAGSAIKFLVVYGGYTNSTATIGGLSITGAYLDSPATTSAVTYKTQFKSEANSSTVIVQHGSAMSTLVLMEVTP
jgi:hypothetical protein